MDKREYYTRVTVEVGYPRDLRPFERKVVIEVDQWDCDLDDMMDLFRSVLGAMGFHSESIDHYFDGDLIEPDSEDMRPIE